MINVTLTPNEVHNAASHALLRRYEKLAGRRKDRMQKGRSDWDNEIEGACAEYAWASHTGKFWTGVSNIKATDGQDVEIRWTKHASGGLIIYPHDDDESVFILARGFAPNFSFVGWMRGAAGKQAGKLTDFGYLVPAEKLNPISNRPNQ